MVRVARGVALTLGLALGVAASPLHAAPEHDAEGPSASEGVVVSDGGELEGEASTHGGHHKEHTSNLLGAKLITSMTILPGGVTTEDPEGVDVDEPDAGRRIDPHFGVGVLYERELIKNKIEFEINVALLSTPDGVVVPIELNLKKPFHVNRHVTPHIGGGPTLEAVFEHGEQEIIGGLMGVAGVYVWFTKFVGIDLEVGYTLLFEREQLAHNLSLGVGQVIHF